ncbi:MAG TPA: acylphosphatase [Acidothermaceae bacterium]
MSAATTAAALVNGEGVAAAGESTVRLTAWVRGQVQGVGFRWWVRSRALELGLVGSATNLEDGRVQVVAEGGRDQCEQLLAMLSDAGAPGRVTGVTDRWSAALGDGSTGTGFSER